MTKETNKDKKKVVSRDAKKVFIKAQDTLIGIVSIGILAGFSGKYLKEHLGNDGVASIVVTLAMVALIVGALKLRNK